MGNAKGNPGEGSPRLSGFKAKDLVALLTVSPRQVRRWRERDYLKSVAGRITEQSFQRFCQERPDRIPYESLDRTTQRWLRDLGYPGSEQVFRTRDAIKRDAGKDSHHNSSVG